MPENILTKQKVYHAAKMLAQKGMEPTTVKVREYLAFTGSQTTLVKYLKAWKLKCFQNYNAENELILTKDFTELKLANGNFQDSCRVKQNEITLQAA